MHRDLQQFFNDSGFKILAMARLSQVEYSVVLYLLNCAVSGLGQVVTNETELSSLIGYSSTETMRALETLSSREIVKLNHGSSTKTHRHSISLGLNYNVRVWKLDFGIDVTVKDAIVFPFVRDGQANLQVFDGQAPTTTGLGLVKHLVPTWQRVLRAFSRGRSLDDLEVERETEAARVLVDTYPVDQVLLVVRHFGTRIPSLSLLASAWLHYQSVFENETQKVDLLGARQKHLDLDDKLREQAGQLLETSPSLSADEKNVLQILINHDHPRRQLFWAYQSRGRYPSLMAFFENNVNVMLPVTTSGHVVRRPHEED